MTGGQAGEPGSPGRRRRSAQSGRSKTQRIAGPRIADRGRQPGEQPRPARRAVPELGEEVGEGEDQERQARVVVVLERRPVDPRPRHPLAGEADRDQGQRRGSAARTPARRRSPAPAGPATR